MGCVSGIQWSSHVCYVGVFCLLSLKGLCVLYGLNSLSCRMFICIFFEYIYKRFFICRRMLLYRSVSRSLTSALGSDKRPSETHIQVDPPTEVNGLQIYCAVAWLNWPGIMNGIQQGF